MRHRLVSIAAIVVGFGLLSPALAADVFVRARIIEPKLDKASLSVGGTIHLANWGLPSETREVTRDQWSPWVDLRTWALHGRLSRVGGLAEWPALTVSVAQPAGTPVKGCTLEVQLADKPDDAGVVITFQEKSDSGTIGFLIPHPLREKISEFETGTQMAARHAAWAKEATAGKSRKLSKFQLLTALWGPYDPALARQELRTLKTLGFNVIGGAPWEITRDESVKTYTATWHLDPDPELSAENWKKGDGAGIEREKQTEEGRWRHANYAHYVVSDEIQTLNLRSGIEPAKLNAHFREYLRRQSVTDASLGKPIDQVEYPASAMFEKTLPRDADLPTRKVAYYAGKFGQWWTVKQLRQTTDLVKQSLPGMLTETLPSDHGFFNAWGAPHTGMGYRGLDFFEIGQQQAVDVLSAEDWLGLNHMYGPSYTWTGGQAFGYLNAILRSGIGDRPIALRGLITPSDDGYLRLKAYSAIGQGAKSFFMWCYGPTFIGTENYWSDLRSEYDGIAKLTAALEKSEDLLADAKTVRDPVAILYSVSHDLWHTDDPAGFVENRLTWCALRHLGIQPDLLREENVEAGDLKRYKVLYVTGQCLTRKASAAIDEWAKSGGVVYLAGGAATRDEFHEPYLPPFAATVWPDDAPSKLAVEKGHQYNERTDLPAIKPLDFATVGSQPADRLPVIGLKSALRSGSEIEKLGSFEDGSPAVVRTTYGKGQITAVGFLPGLAYGQLAGFKPSTLEEKWPAAPRDLLAAPLRSAKIEPLAKADVPVVETNLLQGPKGSVLVLANYTYQPIAALKVTLRGIGPLSRATSTEGVAVNLRQINPTDIELELPLTWTDMILLTRD